MPYTYPPEVIRAKAQWPRLTIYRVAEPRRFAFLWNRYGKAMIGAAVVVGPRCISLTWARPVRRAAS